MRLKVQIRNDNGELLTEWIVPDGEGFECDIEAEIDWLREPFDGTRTNADALLEGAVYDASA